MADECSQCGNALASDGYCVHCKGDRRIKTCMFEPGALGNGELPTATDTKSRPSRNKRRANRRKFNNAILREQAHAQSEMKRLGFS